MIMTEETGRKLTATTFFFSKQTIKKKKLKKGGKFCHWISLADLHMYRWHTGDGADLWPNGQPAAYSGRLSSYRSSCLSEQRTRNVVLSLHWKNLAATPERCFFFFKSFDAQVVPVVFTHRRSQVMGQTQRQRRCHRMFVCWKKYLSKPQMTQSTENLAVYQLPA